MTAQGFWWGMVVLHGVLLTVTWFFVHPKVDTHPLRWVSFVLFLLAGTCIIIYAWPLDSLLREAFGQPSICKGGPVSTLGVVVLTAALLMWLCFAFLRHWSLIQPTRFLFSLTVPVFLVNFAILAFC